MLLGAGGHQRVLAASLRPARAGGSSKPARLHAYSTHYAYCTRTRPTNPKCVCTNRFHSDGRCCRHLHQLPHRRLYHRRCSHACVPQRGRVLPAMNSVCQMAGSFGLDVDLQYLPRPRVPPWPHGGRARQPSFSPTWSSLVAAPAWPSAGTAWCGSTPTPLPSRTHRTRLFCRTRLLLQRRSPLVRRMGNGSAVPPHLHRNCGRQDRRQPHRHLGNRRTQGSSRSGTAAIRLQAGTCWS